MMVNDNNAQNKKWYSNAQDEEWSIHPENEELIDE
jgi:hypothetical protein